MDEFRSDVRELCLSVYRETKAFHPMAEICGRYRLGFEILMGPPYQNPPIAFIGYQPGDWKLSAEEARQAGYEDSWVADKCQYADAEWKLAVVMRDMFGRELLEQCVGMNAIFVRTKNSEEYRKIPKQLRELTEAFCLERVRIMLEAIQPRQVIVIGFETLGLFGVANKVELMNQDGGVLVRIGHVFGRQARAIVHLTGGWGLSKADRNEIAQVIRDKPLSWSDRAQ